MIVRITILNEKNEKEVWLTGDNYKRWFEHFEDFLNYRIKFWCRQHGILEERTIYGVLCAEYNNNKWGFGGLKLCEESAMQEKFDEQGWGRVYEDMPFCFSEDVKKRLNGIYLGKLSNGKWKDLRPNWEEKQELVKQICEEDRQRHEQLRLESLKKVGV